MHLSATWQFWPFQRLWTGISWRRDWEGGGGRGGLWIELRWGVSRSGGKSQEVRGSKVWGHHVVLFGSADWPYVIYHTITFSVINSFNFFFLTYSYWTVFVQIRIATAGVIHSPLQKIVPIYGSVVLKRFYYCKKAFLSFIQPYGTKKNIWIELLFWIGKLRNKLIV